MRVKMGSACCVAARDRTITNGSSSDAMPRNIRHSPSWSVRWDNRRRVAGEETSTSWLSDGVGTNERLDSKSHQTTVGTTYASEEGSPLESFRNLMWQKTSSSEGYTAPQSDQSVSKNPSEVKGSRETELASEPSPNKMSPSPHSVSSFSSSSQCHFLPPSGSTLSRWPGRSPGHHLLRQVSDNQKSPNFSIFEEGSPFIHESHGGSSDRWSVPAFNRERWSFDSESLNFSCDKINRYSGNIQTCGVCSKLLTEKSSFGSQKIIATNELAVVAILICGHVYHAECLENMTSEINKYDPACPVCTFGEKQAFKLSEKALKADLELKAKINKKSRSRVVDGEMNDDVITFDRHRNSGHEGRTPKLSSSSSMKTFTGKPFLKRHFSFGSKGSQSMLENSFSRKKGFFWAKSSKA